MPSEEKSIMADRIEAGKYTELSEGEIHSIEHDGMKIIYYKHDDMIMAFECDCPHVGAPLDKGRIQHDRFYCMAHHASFKLDTGKYIEPPALDNLIKHEVTIENNTIYIHAEPQPQNFPQTVNAKPSPTFVILGAGAAGATAAETLRRHDFKGSIVLISKEARLPYDRTRLSKVVIEKPDTDAAKPLRPADFYEALDIKRITAAVESINPDDQSVKLDSGESLHYDKLLIALGSSPNRPDITGIDLKNIFTLRNPDDAEAISTAAEEADKAVIVGASFIGLECASGLIARGLDVHVVERLSTPFENTLGSVLGKRLQHLHEENGVQFHLNSTLNAFLGDEKVNAVELDDGIRIEADMVILGLGVHPNTGLLKGGINLIDDGGIKVLSDMAVADHDNIFAAGDIASFPWPSPRSEGIRFEHWRTAMQTGQRAALGMLGHRSSEPAIPFFWTRQHKFTLRYIGHAPDPENAHTHGDINSKDFRHNYFHDQQLCAVAASRNDQEMIAIHEAFRTGQIPHKTALKSDKYNWLE